MPACLQSSSWASCGPSALPAMDDDGRNARYAPAAAVTVDPARRAGFGSTKRRGWDSNPRAGLPRPPVFKTGAFNRSATPPAARR